jgi:hypothetical protein
MFMLEIFCEICELISMIRTFRGNSSLKKNLFFLGFQIPPIFCISQRAPSKRIVKKIFCISQRAPSKRILKKKYSASASELPQKES